MTRADTIRISVMMSMMILLIASCGKSDEKKDQQAYGDLKAIGEGALAYFMEEHAMTPAMDPLAYQTEVRFTGRYPETDGEVCTSTGGNYDEAEEPKSSDFKKPIFKSLRFSFDSPRFFKYCITSTPMKLIATATAGDKKFCIIASVKQTERYAKPVLSKMGPCD